MIIFIDSSVLGRLCSTSITDELAELDSWFERSLIRAVVVSSTICDYEVRRGLLLAREQGINADGLPLLDRLHQAIDFLPVDEDILRLAAGIWAKARIEGQPTAGDRNIDADAIICATWQDLATRYPGQEVVIVTTNIRHLGRFANAVLWQDITI
jgi:predicted nucleic acid-binding protein